MFARTGNNMKSLKKTIKYIILLVIIMSLALPSMAALAADDGGTSSMTPEERLNAHIISAIVCIIIAVAVPLIVVSIWTAQLKSVHPKNTAADYMRKGSLNLRVRRDIFLYRKVTKIPRNRK